MKAETADSPNRRKDEILAAAERCFVKSGFHRTTIQAIADDAGMSVGNVYRYFTGKDAIVEALVARDQGRIAGDFDSLATPDPMDAFAALMRRQLVEAGAAKAILWLEISAEAARNPTIASVTRTHKQAISVYLTTFFERVIAERAKSGLATAAEPSALARLVFTLFGGLMLTQAVEPDGIADAGVDQLLAAVSAAIDGRMALGPAVDARTNP